MKTYLYKARWATAAQPTRASVDFYATTDAKAEEKAAKIGRELGVSNVPLTMQRCDYSHIGRPPVINLEVAP